MSRADAEMRLASYVPQLMHDGFPDQAYTVASLGYVAKTCTKGFPTYPEVYNALRAWWRANGPPLPRLAPPAEPEPQVATPEEIERIHGLVRQMAAALAPIQYADQVYRPKPRYLSEEQLRRLNPAAPEGLPDADANAAASPGSIPAGDPTLADEDRELVDWIRGADTARHI